MSGTASSSHYKVKIRVFGSCSNSLLRKIFIFLLTYQKYKQPIGESMSIYFSLCSRVPSVPVLLLVFQQIQLGTPRTLGTWVRKYKVLSVSFSSFWWIFTQQQPVVATATPVDDGVDDDVGAIVGVWGFIWSSSN
jgi:NADH:ubiquinone oxidoreductase subunit 4 (subunit M)